MHLPIKQLHLAWRKFEVSIAFSQMPLLLISNARTYNVPQTSCTTSDLRKSSETRILMKQLFLMIISSGELSEMGLLVWPSSAINAARQELRAKLFAEKSCQSHRSSLIQPIMNFACGKCPCSMLANPTLWSKCLASIGIAITLSSRWSCLERFGMRVAASALAIYSHSWTAKRVSCDQLRFPSIQQNRAQYSSASGTRAPTLPLNGNLP